MLVDADTLADMRAIVNSTLDQTANIYHQQSGQDIGGGSAGGYPSTPDIANVPCMVRPAPGQFQGNTLTGAQVQQATLWLLRFPSGTVIKPTDHVQVGAITYEVKGAASTEQSYTVNTVVTAFEVQS